MDGLKPGRIVYLVASEIIVEQIKAQRSGGPGNRIAVGEELPAMVVKVWGKGGCCNLKVMLDGPDTFWATSVNYSAEPQPHHWRWMYDGQATRGEAK